MPVNDKNLDSYLGEMLTPVMPRRVFTTRLEDRLLADIHPQRDQLPVWQTIAISAVAVIGISLSLFTALRVTILLSRRIAEKFLSKG